MRFFREAWGWFWEAMFPPRCVVTREEGVYLHVGLRNFPPAPENQAIFEYIDRIYAHTAYYDPVVETVVEHFKFKGFAQLADIMAEDILKKLPADFYADALLVPIPLHWTRKIYRGFNQAEVFAQSLARLLNVPVFDALTRHKKTKQQARLDKQSRQQNLQNAFVFRYPKIPRKIILVDDVVASGSTLDQAAKVCKRAGVKEVGAIVFARGGKN